MQLRFHPGGDLGSALHRVWLSDHQAPLAARCRSELRHHLRDVDASAVLHVLGFRRCGPAFTSGFTMGMCLFGAAGLGSTATRPSCKVQGFPSVPNSTTRFQRFPLFLLRMLRHDITAALLLTMCSPVLVLKRSQQPSSRFTASFCCGPEVLCGLDGICSPNAAWNVVNVHRACRTSHFKTELSRLIVAPICRSM